MAKKEKKPADRILAVMADYQRTFATPHGKRVLRRMMKECGMMEPSYVALDPQGTAFNEGKRAAVLEICNRLKMDLRAIEHQLTEKDEEFDTDYID